MSRLSELYREIEACHDCPLAEHRTKVVPGEGPEDAELMFIGEAPGFYEDQQGRPFVGPAGQYLTELLQLIGLRRDEVYICNVIKCRPPGNRDPLPREVKACRKWLEQQIEIIDPRVIITLGRHSMAMFFPGESIGKIHGTARKVGNRICFAMYHPAAALHQQKLRQILESDIRKLPSLVSEAQRLQSQPKQLSMF